jgi:hypothetical protein
VQEQEREDANRFKVAFHAWFEVARIAAECKHHVEQAAEADKLHRVSMLRRSLYAWIEGISVLWKDKQRMALRNTLFYRWHERACAKRNTSSRLRARLKLKAFGWANEVRTAQCKQCCYLCSEGSPVCHFRGVPCMSVGQQVHKVQGCYISCRCSVHLQVHFSETKLKRRCMHAWIAPWQAARRHRRRVLLQKVLLGFQHAVVETDNILLPHWEYWRHGVVLLRAWQCWLTVTLRHKFAKVGSFSRLIITCTRQSLAL